MENRRLLPPPAAEPAAQTLRPLVLVVDDEEALAHVFARALSRAGYDTAIAHSGEAALALLAARRFDVLLTDVHMPRMRGDELQRLARQRDPDLAVLLITAAQDAACAVECLKEGAFDYLLKPAPLGDIVVRVNKACERRRLVRENRDYQQSLEQRVAEQAERLRGMLHRSLESLIHALEAKDENTRNHSARVAVLSAALAARLGYGDAKAVADLRTAALLHDVGKIGVPEAVLNKPGKLDDGEMAKVREHPVLGETILQPLLPPELLAIVRHHHEEWNGAGYPDGLAGEAIPLGARIVAVADAYDAMTSVRPYRPGLAPERARQILQAGAGTQWDANVVAALLDLAQSGDGNENEADCFGAVLIEAAEPFLRRAA